LIKVEIGLPVGLLPEAVEVGLVPYLEIPAAHLVLAVALLEMADEGGDQVVPGLGLRMRGIAVPPEDFVFGGLQRLRREAQLDEWPDPPREQVVVKLVDDGPVVGNAS